MSYDLDEKSIEQHIVPCVLSPIPIPDEIRSKPVHMNLISTTVLNITDFDNGDVLLEKYKKALARQQLMATEMKRQLVMTYGIDVLKYLKTATVDEVMELVAMGEWLRQDLGQFAHSIGHSELIPVSPSGKINKDKLIKQLQSWLFESEKVDVTTPTPKKSDTKQDAPGFDFKKMISDVEKTTPAAHDPEKPNPPREKVTISTIQQKENKDKVHDLSRLREPKLYSGDLSPDLQKRNKIEFNGNLINIWNENMVTLYEKMHADKANPRKHISLEEVQKEDDKSNIVLNSGDDR